MSEDDSSQQLTRLLQDREALDHRLAGIDVQLARLQAARNDELSARLASLEDAVRRLASSVAPAPVAVPGDSPMVAPSVAPPAMSPAGPPAAQPPVPHPPAPQPFVPTAQPGVSPQAPQPAPPQPAAQQVTQPASQPAPGPQPRVIGERAAVDAIALWAAPTQDAAILGWIPRGTRVLLTEARFGNRVQVVYRNRLAWADPHWLTEVAHDLGAATVPASPSGAPASQQSFAPPTGHPVAPAPQPVPPTSQPAPRAQHVPASAPPTSPAMPSALQAGPSAMTPRPPAPPAAPPSAPPSSPVWSRPGFMAKLLALVGAGVTLIGVAFLLVLAAQYGLFGPEARTISAAVLGVALVALAFVVRSRDPRNVGAPILAATGVAAGFLSVVTATVIYGWLPPLLGALLAAAIGLGGMGLARSWDNEWVALTSVLGSLVLAGYVGRAEPVPTAALMIVMTGVTLWFEHGTRWRLFPFARVIPSVLVLLQLITTADRLDDGQRWWLIGLAVALAFLGLVSCLLAPAEPPTEQGIALGLLVPMAVPAGLAAPLATDTTASALVLGLVAVVFATVGFLPMVHARLRWAAVPIGATYAVLAVFTFTQHRYLGVLTLVLATVYLAVAARSRSTVNFVVGGLLAVIGLVGWLPWIRAVFSQRLAEAAEPEQILQSVAGIAVVVLAAFASMRWAGEWRRWMIYTSWALSIAIGSVALVIAGTWAGGQAGNVAAGFQSGHALVTIVWMVLCVVFLRRGLAATTDEDLWLHLALVTAGLAVAKLFLMDLGTLDAIARVGAFLVVGLLLLFVGTRYAKAWERAHGDADEVQAVLPATQPASPAAARPVASADQGPPPAAE